MAHPLSKRPTYSDVQMTRYLSWIGMGSLQSVKAAVQEDPLGTLTRLQRRQMAAVPFGSIVLHYSQSHTVTLDTEALYVKIVDRHMGGYCMENNTFFGTILRSLGYQLYSTGGRVSNYIEGQRGTDADGFLGWTHMINLVSIQGRKYHVDVGFGPQGATAPMLLEEGPILQNVPTLETRMVYRSIVEHADPTQKLWVMEVRESPDSAWNPAYCFTEIEFTPNDFKIMTYYASSNGGSMFTYKMFLTRLVLDQDEKPSGTLTMEGREVKKRENGKSEVAETLDCEPQRVKALEKWFDIKLTAEEIRGIEGMASEIRTASE